MLQHIGEGKAVVWVVAEELWGVLVVGHLPAAPLTLVIRSLASGDTESGTCRSTFLMRLYVALWPARSSKGGPPTINS